MTQITRTIYTPSRERAFEKYLLNLKESEIEPQNKQFIENFVIYLSSKRLSKIRRGKLVYQALRLTQMLESKNPKSLLCELDRSKLIFLISQINDLTGLSHATKSDYCKCLRQMFKWYYLEDARLSSDDAFQREVSRKFYDTLKNDLKTSYKTQQINPNDIITEKDIILVSEKGCLNPKERAFIWTLHETGCRATEFLNLRIGDVEFRSHYAVIQIPDGKTGRRQLYIRNSVSVLRSHIENHPRKDDKNAFLWISDATNRRGIPLMHRGSQKLVSRCFERAGLNKKHNLHWFRHSRATILAPKLTEAVLCKYMGWVIGSGMIKVYAHLCSQDVENSFMQMHGIENEKNQTKPQECDSCHYLNPSTAKYCGRCNKPLSLAVVISDQQILRKETDDTLKKMMEVFSNPQLLAEYQEYLANKLRGKNDTR